MSNHVPYIVQCETRPKNIKSRQVFKDQNSKKKIQNFAKKSPRESKEDD